MQTLQYKTTIPTGEITTGTSIPLPVAPLSLAAPKEGAQRLPYIDNLRWIMIMLVVSMHAAVTYSHLGSWYFMEDTKPGLPETFTFATYQVFLQSFFMGFLFFIAGYFIPKAYDSKGTLKFLKDRAFRLGLPLLFFVFILQPIAIYCIFLFDKQAPWTSFGDLYRGYIFKGRWIGGTGPLWFCEALLIFCAVYAVYRVIKRSIGFAKSFEGNTDNKPFAGITEQSKLPGKKAIWGFIALIAGCQFLVRFPFPNGSNFYNLQFGYFSQYIFFFSAGILAYRGNWLQRFPAAMGRYWGRAAIIGGLILWLGGVILGGALKGDLEPYRGGLHWQSLVECFRDQLAGVGISIFLLLWFRQRFNKQGKMARFFSANAFAVYVFHTPILIILSKMLIGVHWPLLIKFVLLTLLSIAATYILSAGLFRRIPLLKKIL